MFCRGGGTVLFRRKTRQQILPVIFYMLFAVDLINDLPLSAPRCSPSGHIPQALPSAASLRRKRQAAPASAVPWKDRECWRRRERSAVPGRREALPVSGRLLADRVPGDQPALRRAFRQRGAACRCSSQFPFISWPTAVLPWVQLGIVTNGIRERGEPGYKRGRSLDCTNIQHQLCAPYATGTASVGLLGSTRPRDFDGLAVGRVAGGPVLLLRKLLVDKIPTGLTCGQERKRIRFFAERNIIG